MIQNLTRPRVFLAFLFLSIVSFSLTTPAGQLVAFNQFSVVLLASLSFFVCALINWKKLNLHLWQKTIVEALALSLLGIGLYFYNPLSYWLYLGVYTCLSLSFAKKIQFAQLFVLLLAGGLTYISVGLLQRDISYLLNQSYSILLAATFFGLFADVKKESFFESLYTGVIVIFALAPVFMKTSVAYTYVLYPLLGLSLALLFVFRKDSLSARRVSLAFYSVGLSLLVLDYWFEYWH